MSTKSSNLKLFLIGMFSMTQVRLIGSIGIAELAAVIMAPYVFFSDIDKLRWDKFFPALLLICVACIGCVVSSIYNHTPFDLAIRGFATPFVTLSAVLLIYHYLRDNLNGLKWMLTGLACSVIINIFVFQTATEAYLGEMRGELGSEAIISSPIFWIGRISPWLSLPIRGWYLETPFLVSAIVPLFLAGFAMLSSASGRSASLVSIGFFMMIVLARKKRWRILSMQKHFLGLVVLSVVALMAVKMGYQTLAEKGVLSEEAVAKYHQQTKQSKGIVSLIVSGRMDVFVGFMACLDKPIIGHGPWAIDTEGYYERFLSEYGAVEDYDEYIKTKRDQALMGMSSRVNLIPGHSHFITAWLWYGLPGLIMWAYVFLLGIAVLRKHLVSIPQWYGYFAAAIPAMMWNFFFSPFGSRMQDALMIVCFLLARAVGTGRLALPQAMVRQAESFKCP